MDEPLAAHSLNEVRYYLTATICPECGKGPRALLAPEPDPSAGQICRAVVACQNCSSRQELGFTCEYALASSGADIERINPTARPSRIIDLGQWLSLFYLLIETASRCDQPPEVRRLGYRAALCLGEALKFYGDDELPPEQAFFHEATRQAYLDHPESFARQRLRDMQSKLPKLQTMKCNINRDERTGNSARRRWWQFWRQ